MSYADEVFVSVCREILANGVWDTDREVLPSWSDRKTSHTVKMKSLIHI